ncbi:galactokinase [Paractinoplanes brasiliensis]|uniref:Galactokinase n=1 Tax=Paractinoplanes brasiliensis TaxID=52695 RepID=A0A4R6JWY2_9ACTN|nr:galactokinase [Actinoplanes brasiliensis]TDO40171.1 galactokinase [Actinoplanes brasiliensis]GID25237.1 galactokinase [Actinoplanes brasiliensis]
MNALEAFRKQYGAEPSGLWAAPGRVNLIGEHTDYNDGFVLPFALPQRTVAAVGPAPAGEWTVCSTFQDEAISFGHTEPGEVTGWAAYVAGVVWALVEAGHNVPGARIAIDSDVPLGSGLSSSAALESSVLTALVDLGGLDLPVEQRPRLAQRAENEYVGAPTGILDQSASIRCREGHALFLDCRSYEVEQIPFDLAAQGLAILVINSNAPHQHVDGEYGARRKSCEEAARILGVPALRDITGAQLDDALARLDDEVMRRRVRHIVTEDDRVLATVGLLRAGQVREIGPLLTASHASMRDDFEITVTQVDLAVDTALAAGAYGARMTGGGFGGCVLALIDADRADVVTAAVEEAYAQSGFTPPTAWTVTAGPGAGKL